MQKVIPKYHAVYFDEVSAAVEFCDRLVPYVVPRAGRDPLELDRPVVWFHVPPRGARSTRAGCYLFLSPGALVAAGACELDPELSGEISRASLPVGSVLVFGDDVLDSPVLESPLPTRTVRSTAAGYTRTPTLPPAAIG